MNCIPRTCTCIWFHFWNCQCCVLQACYEIKFESSSILAWSMVPYLSSRVSHWARNRFFFSPKLLLKCNGTSSKLLQLIYENKSCTLCEPPVDFYLPRFSSPQLKIPPFCSLLHWCRCGISQRERIPREGLIKKAWYLHKNNNTQFLNELQFVCSSFLCKTLKPLPVFQKGHHKFFYLSNK